MPREPGTALQSEYRESFGVLRSRVASSAMADEATGDRGPLRRQCFAS